MREILFRGKTDSTPSEWVYGDLSQIAHPVSIEHEVKQKSGGKLPFSSWVLPDTVGQFTGMKDGKDNKIFEGDIVRDKSEKKNYCVVYMWQDAGFYLSEKIDYNPVETRGRPLGRRNNYSINVIGNIFDNPELLNEK